MPVVFKERGMKIKVATIFPEMFSALEIGLLGKARQNGQIGRAHV